MFIDIYVRYIQMHLFYISSIVYTEEENVYVYIPSKKSIEGSAGLRLELKITTTDFRSCHKVLV